MKKKKLLLVFLMCLTLCNIVTISITAAPKTSGMDKEGIEWSYDKETKTLTFSGKGKTEKMYNEIRGSGKEAPWDCWRKKCEKVVFEEGITEIGAGYLYDFDKIKRIELPQSLQIIQKEAFMECRNLDAIEFPSQLKEIGENAFAFCKLKEVNLPKSVKEIGEFAFGSNNLREIEWSEAISYGSCVYGDNYNVSKVTFSEGLKELPDGYMCGVRKISKAKFPPNITKISNSAFTSAKVREVTLPNTVKRIEDRAFSHAKIEKLILNEGLEYIGNEAFEGTQIDEIIIPDTVTYIGKTVFSDCEAKKIVLSPNTPMISEGMFKNCQKLKSIVIPKEVIEIGMGAFWNCYELETMIIESNKIEKIDPTSFGGEKIEDAFGNELNYFKDLTIYVPETCVSKYKGYLEKIKTQRKYQILPIKKESQLVENTQSEDSSFAGKIWIVAGIFVVVLVGVMVGRRVVKRK